MRIFFPLILFALAITTATGQSIDSRKWKFFDEPHFDYQVRIKPDGGYTLLLRAFADNYVLNLRGYRKSSDKAAIFTYSFPVANSNGRVMTFDLPEGQTKFYLDMNVSIGDGKRQRNYAIWVDRTNSEATPFHLTDDQGYPIIGHHVKPGQIFKVFHADSTVRKLYIKYFEKPVAPAPPPFSDRDPRFNPLKYAGRIVPIKSGQPIALPESGLYVIQADTFKDIGFPINSFSQDFPNLTSASEMVFSARYISKNKEYVAMKESEKARIQVEDFWLDITGDKDKAREKIKKYYNRVREANELFTIWKEGWKSDKGLIYIVFGPPSTIKLENKIEIWRYPANEHREAVDFIFDYRLDQWVLRRDRGFDLPWSAEIWQWRNGGS